MFDATFSSLNGLQALFQVALRTNIAMSDYKLEDIVVFVDLKLFKGSDRLCKVVELSMQSCGQIL